MLLTISTRSGSLGDPSEAGAIHPPTYPATYLATDLGYLLHKHPDRVQRFEQSFGTATVFYPEASAERCTVALLLEVDPIRLARTRRPSSPDFSLGQYVNDRPYAASSLLGAAMADVFGTARAGRCRSRQELADSAIELEIELPVLPCRGGAALAVRLFAPLGWLVDAQPIPLDEAVRLTAGAGDGAGDGDGDGDGDDGRRSSRYVRLRLSGRARLADALNQLYVLLPVLDESKHYWQGPDEVDKLLRSGEGWLGTHPERELVAGRYLQRRDELTRVALARLVEADGSTDGSTEEIAAETGQDSIEDTGTSGEDPGTVAAPRVALAELRRRAVLDVLTELGATSVIDLGCGSGQLLRSLAPVSALTRLAGCDVSTRALRAAARRLRLDEEASERRTDRMSLFQAALTYQDERFAGYDAAVLMEVIEHVDAERLGALERVVFGAARPTAVLVTTPNSDYNVVYQGLEGMRHHDHRFEFSRAEFARWTQRVAATYGYRVAVRGIGEPDERFGTPTQMAVFTRG
ncbi:MAG: 3' terminal RNA ribose 2'-O-methyltransferase Hen1 [Nocardioides sp.]|uniref:3' terminal RNA ribose 2'-O-methyltransferase Hen1 n=1 Tax=Nocardioides sp. TaxID=35761 RepID=UPI0039E289F9